MKNNPLNSNRFIAIDGDDVGIILRDRIISNDIQGASFFSNKIHHFFFELQAYFEQRDCITIFCGGDSLLVSTETNIPISWFNSLPLGPCNISIGIGETAEYAYLALQLAKARGKKQVVEIQGVSANTLLSWHNPSR